MFEFKVKQEKLMEWFPKTQEIFIEELRNSKSTYSDKDIEKMDWSVSFAFFVNKAKTEEEKIKNAENFESKFTLQYEERCAIDLPKLRVSLSMKAGHYYRTDRIFDEIHPDVIDIFYNFTRIMMINEQFMENNPVVLKSLENFNLDDEIKSLGEKIGIPIETQISSTIEEEIEEELSMDEILDKISDHGMESLSAKELKYLEKMSTGK